MILFPNCYFKKATDVSIEFLKRNKIKGLILDVDNTIIDFHKVMLKHVDIWCENLKKEGIKFCILSNSNKVEKVKKVAETLGIPYTYFATKPLKRGFKKAQQCLGLKNEKIAVIGDQILTDVIGANRNNMFSILVEPIEEKDIFITRIKRPIEKLIIKKYEKSTKG